MTVARRSRNVLPAQGTYTFDQPWRTSAEIGRERALQLLSGMPPELDKVLWELEDDAEPREEPSVIVDPTMEAFCLMRTRMARGTSPPPAGSGRLTLELIRAFMIENADPSGS